MRDISFGQYYPVKSPVHRMDPRTKLVAAIAYIVMLFFIPTLSSWMKNDGNSTSDYMLIAGICYGMMLLFVITAVLFSRVPLLKVLRSVRMILLLIIFMSVLTLFFYGGEATEVYWSWKFFSLSKESIVNSAAMSLRLIFLVLGPSLLTLTTTPVELTDGLESLLKPLKWIKVPVHELAIIMSLALRLIPSLSEETQKIMNAQKARCADFESGNIFKKAKALLPVLIPLFVSAFRRADELADAMDSRCYRGAKGRTRMKVLRFSWRDLFAFLTVTAVFVLILALRYGWFSLTPLILSMFSL